MHFKSLKNNEKGYSWHYESMNGHGISPYANQFDTYGDGMTQHSPYYHVGIEQLQDYLFSMAAHLQEFPEDIKALDGGGWWNYSVSGQQINFFKKLIYDEKKTRYYNKSEMKVSSAPSKRYDTRWKEVPTWADGSFMTVFGFMKEDHYNMLQRLDLLIKIWQWYDNNGDYQYISMDDYGFGDLSWHVTSDAFNAVNNLWIAYFKTNRSKSLVENYKRMLQEERERI